MTKMHGKQHGKFNQKQQKRRGSGYDGAPRYNKQMRLDGYNYAALEDLKKTQSKKSGPSYTLSIAVPGSILDKVASAELKAYVTGQIARAAAVFCADEVVVYEDKSNKYGSERSCSMMSKILQFLECPQYLRKSLFPLQDDLKFAGLLNPLDCPHHLRVHEVCQYRDGAVLEGNPDSKSLVNIGLHTPVEVDQAITPGLRVTVKLHWSKEEDCLKGKVVSPSEPLRKYGIYWGYTTREATNFPAVLSECPYEEGYDLLIGTSERGKTVSKVKPKEYKHVMIVFGGLQGIETALNAEDSIKDKSPKSLFHYYLNTCPGQGSRTIRTEEAVFISLSSIKTRLDDICKKINKGDTNEEL